MQYSPPICLVSHLLCLPAVCGTNQGRLATVLHPPTLPCCGLHCCAAALINQRLKEADLSADDAAVLEEEPHLKAALEAAEAAEAVQGGAAQPPAAQAVLGTEEEEAALAASSSRVELVSCWELMGWGGVGCMPHTHVCDQCVG